MQKFVSTWNTTFNRWLSYVPLNDRPNNDRKSYFFMYARWKSFLSTFGWLRFHLNLFVVGIFQSEKFKKHKQAYSNCPHNCSQINFKSTWFSIHFVRKFFSILVALKPQQTAKQKSQSNEPKNVELSFLLCSNRGFYWIDSGFLL